MSLTTREIHDRALVRLISTAYHKPPVMRALADTEADLRLIEGVEAMTSARLRAEAGALAGLDRRELAWERRTVSGEPYGLTHINAAFAYTRPEGNRFNTGARGAWYCAWATETCLAEVAFHRRREMLRAGFSRDSGRYVELLCDVTGSFPSLTPPHEALHPEPERGYPAGQRLAAELRGQGARGLAYPSVRGPGDCLALFDPRAVQNVRPGASWELAVDAKTTVVTAA